VTFDPNAPLTSPVGYQPPQASQPGPTLPPTQTPPQPTQPDPASAPPTQAPQPPAPFVPPAPPAPTFVPPASGALAHGPVTGVPQHQPSQYHQNVERSGFTDDVKTGDFDAYKGTKNRTDRLGMLTPRDITWGRVHYVQDKGFFICDSKFKKTGGQEVPDHLAMCCQRLGSPKKRFVALIAQYATDNIGRLLQPFQFTFKVWRFNEQLFDQLRTLNRDFPFEQYDVMAKCTDDQYWKYEVMPARECLVHSAEFRKTPDPNEPGSTWGQQVDGYIASMRPRLERIVAKANNMNEWVELLGVQPGGFGPPAGGYAPAGNEAPIENIAALLGGPK
jgi:hypothetical protein